MYPELFKAAVADVPFVDVVNTMSDPTIPLTVVGLPPPHISLTDDGLPHAQGEWEEWGNPNEREFFDYMSQYCPYTNVKAQVPSPPLVSPSSRLSSGLPLPPHHCWAP